VSWNSIRVSLSKDLHFVDGAPSSENGGHLLRANQFCAEARPLISRGSRPDAKQ